MKIFMILTLMELAFLFGCASSPKPAMPTFKEAVANGDVESGWYAKQNRENVYVDVQNPRQKSEEAEKKAFEAQREADYKQRQVEQLQYENTLLRVRSNYKLEKQVNEIQGYDNQNNPIIKQKTVSPEPQQAPPEAARKPVKSWDTSEYDSYNDARKEARLPPRKAPPQREPEPVEDAPVEPAPPVVHPIAQPSVPSLPKAPEVAQAAPRATAPQAPAPVSAVKPAQPVARAPASAEPNLATAPVEKPSLVSELPKPLQ